MNNAIVNVAITNSTDNTLVVTANEKEYVFEKNKATAGLVHQNGEFPFPVFQGIRTAIAERGWVSGYVLQDFDGKQAALIMAGTEEEMRIGNIAMTWFTTDINTVEATYGVDAKLVSKEGTVSVYEADGKKFCFDDAIAKTGVFIREDALGIVLPAAVAHALSKPCRMAVYKYQGDTLMIEVYKAPRAWTDGNDGMWIFENVLGINPTN